MREIKFRIWNETGKRMLYDSSLAFKGNKVIEEIGTKVMQNIGLKDKNGKEIFEGDILKSPQLHQKFKVEFLSTGFYPVAAYEETIKWKVIGNIYENPNLINHVKGEKQ